MRELPVARDVARRVDVRDRCPPLAVRLDPLARVERDAGLLEPDALDERRAADGDEHEVALDRLTLAEVDDERGARVLDLRALLAEVERDAALAEGLRQLLRRVEVLLRDQRVEHLDDRDLGAEPLEDRRELAADDAAAENDEALRHLRLRQQAGRVDARGESRPGWAGASGTSRWRRSRS